MRIALAAALAALAVASQAPAQSFEPENVECIAPAAPGGGWDFTCRKVSSLLTEQDLVDGSIKVTNMPGASGAVAYANVASKRADDPNLIVATSTVGITNIAQGKYPAGVDEMRWLAMLGADVAVAMVNKGSDFETLDGLMQAIAEAPGDFVAGGSSPIGGWDHIRLLMLAEEAGLATEDLSKIRWVEYSGGGDAVTQLMGEHLDLVLTDIGEIGGFIRSGDVKALGVMADERLEAYPDLATAKEQGLDAEGYNWRGFYVGGDVSDEAYEGWVSIMQDLYESEAWKEAAKEAGLTPIWRGGEEMETFARESEQRATEISKAIGIIQ
ncbi:MAG: Bug family tripartite tricarboxylate transporter substrate binding protein [Paracoccaceae bacterium]